MVAESSLPTVYAAFTEALRARLADDPRVLGLVAVGSMANRDYAPDAWSDHDFFVIAPEPETLRNDLSWLPEPQRIALSFRETEHGVKVVYDDGHLLEFAVFDLEELAVAGVNRYRVLLDRGGVEERVAALHTEPHGDEWLFGMFVTGALVAYGRARRGELLSASFFVVQTLRHLTALVGDAPILDDLDPLRRFERAYPELGSELASIVRRSPAVAAVALLDVGERELRERRPELGWAGFDAVSGTIKRAVASG
jgi:hypothetical protein